MKNLWISNTPEIFWRSLVEIKKKYWQEAIQKGILKLYPQLRFLSVDELLFYTLGEGQFGEDHWRLNFSKRAYYLLKPILPRSITKLLRRITVNINPSNDNFPLGWPIENKYASFQWDVMKNLLEIIGRSELPFIDFWPNGHQAAFVLTHDIETGIGQANVRRIAELEMDFGFRSCFNFVPKRYPIDYELIEYLNTNGFEIGIHGLKHDGRLFNSKKVFDKRAIEINQYLKKFNVVGFRSPLTLRHPEWMQSFDIEYDSSFFDTDPFEPMPGGAMSIWPFEIGKFIELPYTLAQDNTLINILKEKSIRLWLEKIIFLEKYHGMILLIVHPDYLLKSLNWNLFIELLQKIKNKENYWYALPKEVASWWRARNQTQLLSKLPGGVKRSVSLDNNGVFIA